MNKKKVKIVNLSEEFIEKYKKLEDVIENKYKLKKGTSAVAFLEAKSEFSSISDKLKYYDLVDKVSMKRSKREEYINKIVKLLQVKFNEVNIDCEVYGRPKHFYSIYNIFITCYINRD